MTKTVKIDGIDVPMRASAASPRIYRTVFGGDLLLDLNRLRENYKKGEKIDLSIIENMAYLFAYQANEDIDDIDTWLDQFSFTAIYNAMPEILELWNENEKTTSKSKN